MSWASLNSEVQVELCERRRRSGLGDNVSWRRGGDDDDDDDGAAHDDDRTTNIGGPSHHEQSAFVSSLLVPNTASE